MRSSVGTALAKRAATQSLSNMLRQAGVFSGAGEGATLNPGWEIITQPIRDYQTYPTTGFRTLSYFQAQAGSAGTTAANQNMPAAGFFPRGQMFLVEGLEVDFKPAGEPAQVEGAIDVPTTLTNDMWNVLRTGNLTMTISTRPYLNVGPLTQFPPSFRIFGAFAISSTTTAAGVTPNNTFETPIVQGDNFQLIPFMLQESVNFVVALNFDAPVTVTTAGLLGVNMNGCLIRRNQ